MITLYDVPSFKLLIEERWIAVALLYGPPPPNFHSQWAMTVAPLEFRMALEKVFHPEEVQRVGLRRMAMDYYDWYHNDEDPKRQSISGDGSLPRA